MGQYKPATVSRSLTLDPKRNRNPSQVMGKKNV